MTDELYTKAIQFARADFCPTHRRNAYTCFSSQLQHIVTFRAKTCTLQAQADVKRNLDSKLVPIAM